MPHIIGMEKHGLGTFRLVRSQLMAPIGWCWPEHADDFPHSYEWGKTEFILGEVTLV